MSTPAVFDYDWAVVRVVPHVHQGGFEPVGVVLHARQARFLGVRLGRAENVAARCALDAATLGRFFEGYRRIGEAEDAGALGRLPPSERFHWMTTTRSTILQTSPVHTGRSSHPAEALGVLFDQHVPAAFF